MRVGPRALKTWTFIGLVFMVACTPAATEKSQLRRGIDSRDLPFIVPAPSDISKFGSPRTGEGVGWPEGEMNAHDFVTSFGGTGETLDKLNGYGFVAAYSKGFITAGFNPWVNNNPGALVFSEIAVFKNDAGAHSAFEEAAQVLKSRTFETGQGWRARNLSPRSLGDEAVGVEIIRVNGESGLFIYHWRFRNALFVLNASSVGVLTSDDVLQLAERIDARASSLF